jgi:hypothetical protein
MAKHLQLLNKVQEMLIDFANRKGINLADDFATVQEFKDFVIALTFKLLTENGVSTAAAFDMIAGDGAYERSVENLWNHFNAA